MIISFSLTTDALLSGQKTCTRRVWKPRTIASWQKAYDEGRLIHDAVDKHLYRGGKYIAKIELTCRPYQERLADMPEGDLIHEGGLWETREEFWALFDGPEQVVTVVRFEVVAPDDRKEEIG